MKFREWLLSQGERRDFVGDFVKEACVDPSFLLSAKCAWELVWEFDEAGHPMWARALADAWDEWRRLMIADRRRKGIPWRPTEGSVEFARECHPHPGHCSQCQSLYERHGDRWLEQLAHWEPQDRPGYVYCLRADNGFYKVGRTVNIQERLKAIRQSVSVVVPYDLELVVAYETDDCHELERILHARWADKRVKGEWFALNAETEEVLRHHARDGQDRVFATMLYEPEWLVEMVTEDGMR